MTRLVAFLACLAAVGGLAWFISLRSVGWAVAVLVIGFLWLVEPALEAVLSDKGKRDE